MAVESGSTDMLRELFKYTLDTYWAKLDWNELVLMAVRFRKSDMLGEVLQLMPDLNFAKLTGKKARKYWSSLATSTCLERRSNICHTMSGQKRAQMLFEAGAVNMFGEML